MKQHAQYKQAPKYRFYSEKCARSASRTANTHIWLVYLFLAGDLPASSWTDPRRADNVVAEESGWIKLQGKGACNRHLRYWPHAAASEQLELNGIKFNVTSHSYSRSSNQWVNREIFPHLWANDIWRTVLQSSISRLKYWTIQPISTSHINLPSCPLPLYPFPTHPPSLQAAIPRFGGRDIASISPTHHLCNTSTATYGYF